MKRKYLTSPTACKLYKIKIKKDKVRPNSDWTSCFIIKDEENANDLIKKIRSTFEKFKDRCKWNGDKRYFYVSTGRASYFKNLHVIKDRIQSLEGANDSQPYNYFETRADAEELLRELKKVFRQFGFVFEKD